MAGQAWWRVGLGVGLAGGGAAAAWWLGGHQAVWLGAVIGAVTGSFAPSLTGWLKERRQAREALAGFGEKPGGSPAGLLDPRRGVAGFLGRETELAGLLAWCGDGRARGVRLVTGPGGVGKTRLSVELCTRLAALGWWCERPGDGEDQALSAIRRVHRGRVLVVVDYAETRAGLGGLLRAVAADEGPVRVLLLARSAGEWWDRLAAGEPTVRELLAAAGAGDPLPVAVTAGLSNEEIVAAAVPAFAAALKVPPPARVAVEAGSGAVRVLDLHAAALVGVLRSAGGRRGVTVRVTDVLDELLGHEARFWQGSADRLGLTDGAGGLTTGELRRIVAAGALLGAGSQEDAVALLGRVPVAGSVKLAQWLRDLYPPTDAPDGGWLGSLAPDRLAERLVVAELGSDPELAGRCLTGLDGRQALRSVTLLGRAAADKVDAPWLLERLLPLVGQVVAELPDDLDLLTAISYAIPYPSTALADAGLAVIRRILPLVPADRPALRAQWLAQLGITLDHTGEAPQALSAAEEAVAIYRELAAADPDRYRPDLATSLTNLAGPYSELGRRAEALPTAEEAVAIRRELAAADPDRYRTDLATSLTNLGLILVELGRLAEALAAEEEAVAIRRELAAAYPDRYRTDRAHSLSTLGGTFSRLGRHAEALAAEEEAVAIRRELAAASPDRYRPDLAASLNNVGILLWELGHQVEALAAEEEAVAIRRELAAASPNRYRPDLACSLSNLGVPLSELGRWAEALAAEEEAVAIRRELAAASPDRHRPDLALSLSNLGIWLSELGRRAEALAAEEEAVAIRRELVAASPERHRPDLARSLSNLGDRLSEVGRRAEALAATREAVTIRRELAAAYPDRHRPELARALSQLGNRLCDLERMAEALAATQEAVTIYRELAAAFPDRHRANLVVSVHNLGIILSKLGREAEALPPAQEAVTIYRELAAANPGRYRPELARSLTSLGVQFSLLDRLTEALSATQEAVTIHRELAAANPGQRRPELIRSLRLLAYALDGLGHTAEAQEALNNANFEYALDTSGLRV